MKKGSLPSANVMDLDRFWIGYKTSTSLWNNNWRKSDEKG